MNLGTKPFKQQPGMTEEQLQRIAFQNLQSLENKQRAQALKENKRPYLHTAKDIAVMTGTGAGIGVLAGLATKRLFPGISAGKRIATFAIPAAIAAATPALRDSEDTARDYATPYEQRPEYAKTLKAKRDVLDSNSKLYQRHIKLGEEELTPKEKKRKGVIMTGLAGTATSAIPLLRGPEVITAKKYAPKEKEHEAMKKTFLYGAIGSNIPFAYAPVQLGKDLWQAQKEVRPIRKILRKDAFKNFGKSSLLGYSISVPLGGIGAAYGFHKAVKPEDYEEKLTQAD